MLRDALTRQEKVDPKDLARRLEKAKLNQIARWREEAKEKQPSILHAIKIEIGHSIILQNEAIRTKKAIPNTWRDVSSISGIHYPKSTR